MLHEEKVQHFIQTFLDDYSIKKLNFWGRLKFRFHRLEIVRQKIEPLREKISCYKNGFLREEAEFNIKGE
jgi:hypothetical protein